MSLPARFRRSRLLIVGCGDVGSRLLPRVSRHQTVRVLTSSPARCEALRAAGVTPLVGNLDIVGNFENSQDLTGSGVE